MRAKPQLPNTLNAPKPEDNFPQDVKKVPFGKKLWHKFAIGFIVVIALPLAALIIGSALSGN